jgi:hypothetical protein
MQMVGSTYRVIVETSDKLYYVNFKPNPTGFTGWTGSSGNTKLRRILKIL